MGLSAFLLNKYPIYAFRVQIYPSLLEVTPFVPKVHCVITAYGNGNTENSRLGQFPIKRLCKARIHQRLDSLNQHHH